MGKVWMDFSDCTEQYWELKEEYSRLKEEYFDSKIKERSNSSKHEVYRMRIKWNRERLPILHFNFSRFLEDPVDGKEAQKYCNLVQKEIDLFKEEW